MGTTFVIIPKEEEAKNGLLQLVGELEFFFSDQVKVHDALALESSSTTMEAFLGMLAVQVDEKAIARAVEPEDVWAPISEIDTWQPLGDPEEAMAPLTTGNLATLPGAVLICLECGIPLTGKKKKFCSNKCYMKDYNRRHPGKKHKNNGNGSSGMAEDNGSSGAVEETGLAMGQMTIDQLLPEDEVPGERQVMRWKILSSGLEVNELGHLLKKGVLPIGEQVREKEKGLFEVVRGVNGSRVLRRIEAGPLGL